MRGGVHSNSKRTAATAAVVAPSRICCPCPCHAGCLWLSVPVCVCVLLFCALLGHSLLSLARLDLSASSSVSSSSSRFLYVDQDVAPTYASGWVPTGSVPTGSARSSLSSILSLRAWARGGAGGADSDFERPLTSAEMAQPLRPTTDRLPPDPSEAPDEAAVREVEVMWQLPATARDLVAARGLVLLFHG